MGPAYLLETICLLAIMIDSEKLLKDLNLRLAHFGDPDFASARSLLPHSIPSMNTHQRCLEIAAKLVFKIE